MSQQEKLQAALAELASLQERITSITQSLKRFPEEPPIGTVLKIFKRHDSGYVATSQIGGRRALPTVYTYVAIRATPRGWYMTGRKNGDKGLHTWDSLVEFIGDSDVEEATGWRAIGEEDGS